MQARMAVSTLLQVSSTHLAELAEEPAADAIPVPQLKTIARAYRKLVRSFMSDYPAGDPTEHQDHSWSKSH